MKTALQRLCLACMVALAVMPVSLPTFASQASVARKASPAKAETRTPITDQFTVLKDKQFGLVVSTVLPSGRSTYGIPPRRTFTLLPDTGIERQRPGTPPPIEYVTPFSRTGILHDL